MKCLSLLQPWATLVAIGAKKIETRSWSTAYRGPLAIHASKGFPREAQFAWTRTVPIYEALAAAGYWQVEHFPFGAIVAVCDLTGCEESGVIGDYTPEPERSFGDYTPGRRAWHLANVRELPKPIPAKGSLGLWTPALDLLEKIRAEV